MLIPFAVKLTTKVGMSRRIYSNVSRYGMRIWAVWSWEYASMIKKIIQKRRETVLCGTSQATNSGNTRLWENSCRTGVRPPTLHRIVLYWSHPNANIVCSNYRHRFETVLCMYEEQRHAIVPCTGAPSAAAVPNIVDLLYLAVLPT